jgi:hypothetical protein
MGGGVDFRIAERQLAYKRKLYRKKYVQCYSSIPIPEFVSTCIMFLYFTTARGCEQIHKIRKAL